jgi:hypothetical protein
MVWTIRYLRFSYLFTVTLSIKINFWQRLSFIEKKQRSRHHFSHGVSSVWGAPRAWLVIGLSPGRASWPAFAARRIIPAAKHPAAIFPLPKTPMLFSDMFPAEPSGVILELPDQPESERFSKASLPAIPIHSAVTPTFLSE